MARSRQSTAKNDRGTVADGSSKEPINNAEQTSSSGGSPGGPDVPLHVIAKVLIYSLAMLTLPLASYFLSIDSLFGGNTTYAAILAAVVANTVLVGYVIQAWVDDQSEQREAEAEGKKDR